MQKWEYLFVGCNEGRTRWVNGSELPGWKSNKLFAWANQRGEEGWELVSDSAWTGSFAYDLVFKRPKS